MNLKKLLTLIKNEFANGWLPIGNTYIMKGSNLILYGIEYNYDLYKIGTSSKPYKRVIDLKYLPRKLNCSIKDLKIIALFPLNIEELMHEEFKKDKVVGEWFKYSKDLEKLIILFNHYNNWKHKLMDLLSKEEKRSFEICIKMKDVSRYK